MLDFKLIAHFPHHLIIQVGAVVRHNLPRQTVSADDLLLNEPDHHTPGDASLRRGFEPFSEVINRYKDETMSI